MKTTLAGYQINQLIYDGTRTLVYGGVKTDEEKPVVLKKLRKEYPTFNELLQFRHQYVLSKNLDLPGIVRPIALEKYGLGYVLVMEDVGGVSLSEYCSDRPLDIEEFLTVAIALTKILSDLYQNRVIHKDIKPANILINPETQEIFLIDFSISSLLPRETQEIQNPNILEGTLAYISPEQTGRMNRGIDYRSDFYSLGVTFYELLTGEMPYHTDDPMELVHCHIAREAIPPRAVRPEIPQALSELVMKLMAKTAEERYQSALGIKYDLEKCLQQWQETGNIGFFQLGERDISDRFLIPERLYGREAEVQGLLDAFERVATGNCEMMLVAGFSGIGKTAVVNEVHKPIVQQRGYFIKGKFDQFQRNIPFSAFVQAFRDLMGQLPGESDLQLQKWKTQILDALGESAGVIIEVIPELEAIIGEQPEVAELSGSAAQNRFNLLFGKFIRVFTTKEHPLVIFLDDLQWADLASLKLMQLLMDDCDLGYLLLLGAYRDNEVFSAHPLMLTIEEISKSGATFNAINLTPLSPKELERLVADTLYCSSELGLPLTELIYQKTKGNPFFTTQFLKSLHEDGWIKFNFALGHWQCDLTQVRQLALTDDVVEFMAARLHKLPEQTREMLKVAACIGNQFDLGTLTVAREQSQVEVAQSLWGALQEGLVLPVSDTYKFFQGGNQEEKASVEDISVGYKFLHDRVQQAAYSLIIESQKQNIHYQIGRRILVNTPESQLHERIFEIVNQLNIGRELIDSDLEKKRLSELNFLAGQKAKLSTACEAAKTYFTQGIKLLDRDRAWEESYSNLFQLHLALAEAQLMSVDFDSLERTIALLLQFAKFSVDITKIYALKVTQHTLQSRYASAIQAGIEGLQKIGINVNRDNLNKLNQEELISLERSIEEKIDNNSILSLLDLPTLTDPDICSTVKLLETLDAPAYFSADLDLYSFVSLKAARLSVEYGNIPESIKAYANYGFILGLKNQHEKGYEFANLAIQLSYKLNSKSQQCKVSVAAGGWIQVWAKPIQGAAKINYEGFLAGMDSGEIQFAGYNLFSHVGNRIFAGENLENIATDIEKYLLIAEKIKHDLLQSILEACRFFAKQLSQSLDGIEGREDWIHRHEVSQGYMPLGIYYILQMQSSCLFQNFELGFLQATEARKFIDACAGFTLSGLYYYYSSLILLEVGRDDALHQIETNQTRLKGWSENCPANFEHKYLLVEAERSRVEGKKIAAIELYDKAIAGAKANEYIQEEALANERAALFYLEWGKEKIAATYMQEAYYCYARWGAKAKIDDLEKRYQTLLAPIKERQKLGLTPSSTVVSLSKGKISTTTSTAGEILDLATLMKASRALSQDISLEGAIANLMQVAMENAGAETAALMLFEGEVLMLTALVTAEGVKKIDPIPVSASNAVPMSIVNKVKRSRKHEVSDNASNETAYAGDTYILQYRPLSILCLPLIDRGQLRGILYLENNRVAGAFTGDRLEVLNLLCSQAAISIENARLYQQAQQALTDLQKAQLQLVQSEKMSALGNLVAGVAHEINNPVGFIGGNLEPTLDYIQELFSLISLYQQKMPFPDPEIEAEIERIDLEFVREDLLQIISAMQEGTERLTHISTSLRTFSRTDKEHKVPFKLEEGLESTLLILKHRLKASDRRPAIEVAINFGNLPSINCYPGQLNQVFMNLLANAIDALEEGSAERSFEEIKANPNRIYIETYKEGDRAMVKIADNGTGMPESVKERIFEQGFTTKPVGKGTGLGMAIAYQIVVEKHGGTLTCTSEKGKGTEFAIALPFN